MTDQPPGKPLRELASCYETNWTNMQMRQFLVDHGLIIATGVENNDEFASTAQGRDVCRYLTAITQCEFSHGCLVLAEDGYRPLADENLLADEEAY